MTDTPSSLHGRPVALAAYRLEAGHRRWRGDAEIPFRPTSWDVLSCLVERPGIVVTEEGLHREVWPDAAVSDNTLTQVINEGDMERCDSLDEGSLCG